jgi:hypothetical protein
VPAYSFAMNLAYKTDVFLFINKHTLDRQAIESAIERASVVRQGTDDFDVTVPGWVIRCAKHPSGSIEVKEIAEG